MEDILNLNKGLRKLEQNFKESKIDLLIFPCERIKNFKWPFQILPSIGDEIQFSPQLIKLLTPYERKIYSKKLHEKYFFNVSRISFDLDKERGAVILIELCK